MIGLALESVRQQEYFLLAEELSGDVERGRLPLRVETVRDAQLRVPGKIRHAEAIAEEEVNFGEYLAEVLHHLIPQPVSLEVFDSRHKPVQTERPGPAARLGRFRHGFDLVIARDIIECGGRFHGEDEAEVGIGQCRQLDRLQLDSQGAENRERGIIQLSLAARCCSRRCGFGFLGSSAISPSNLDFR